MHPRPSGGPAVVVVTDSTASLPAGAAERSGVEVVPLEVALGDVRYREGEDLVTGELVAALTAGTRVSTSQPAPAAFARAYARAAERGAREIVSVHLSAELSGTVGAAQVAARTASVPVRVVDSRSVAMGLGAGVLAAAALAAGEPGRGPWAGRLAAGAGTAGSVGDGAAAAAGVDGDAGAARVADGDAGAAAGVDGDAEAAHGVDGADAGGVDGAAVADRAREVAAAAADLYLVDSLEHLRRGGRIGSAAAAVGTLLGMRPLLTVRGGRVEVAGKVRTRRAARERLVEHAASEAARRTRALVAVHHLGQPDVAEALAAEIRSRVGEAVDVVVAEVSAVVGAHAGPGLLGVVAAEAQGRSR